MKKPSLSFLLVAALCFLPALAACSSVDVTPPADYLSPTNTGPTQAAFVFPLVPPDPVAGKTIYEERCQDCHGANGKGDGPQASKLPVPSLAIGSPAVARTASPSQWFQVVTQGELEKYMPGFSTSLNDRQRWDVVAYTFTLGVSAQELQQGKNAFTLYCVSCHGERGVGSGAQAVSLGLKTPDWSDPTRLVKRSANDLLAFINQGSAGGMPAFTDKLAETQRAALAAYVRSLGFLSQEPSQVAAKASPTTAVAPQPALTSAAGRVNISGRVNNASGGTLPAGLKVNLQGYDGMTAVFDASTDLQPDGTYLFKDLEFTSGRVFITSVTYQEISFSSEAAHISADPAVGLALDIDIYDSTSDPSALLADRMHVFLDFSKAGSVQVAELLIISNPTNKVVRAAQPNQPALVYTLPVGAANLQFEGDPSSDRFVPVGNGFGDMLPVEPGSGNTQVLFAYEMPYTDKLAFNLTVPLRVQAVVVMMPTGGVTLQSSQLRDNGQRTVENLTMQVFTGSPLPAGGKLELALSGRPAASSTQPGITSQNVLFGAGVFVLVLTAVIYWVFRQRKPAADAASVETSLMPNGESEDTLVDAIIALDDQYEAGNISAESYQERRTELKERLASHRAAEHK